MPRVDLHLSIRVSPEKRDAFNAFLREAIPFYESPGGIKVRLVQDAADPTRLIELIEYASEVAYQRDQQRIESDPTMKQYLERWRTLLDGPPEVLVYRDASPTPAAPFNPNPQPTLRTARLILRPFDPSDADEMLPLIGAKEVAATTALIPHPYERHHADQWLAARPTEWTNGTGMVFAICEHTSSPRGRLVGAIGLHGDTLRHKRSELGYWIGVPFWDKGYATEAARAVIDWAFANLDVNRIFAYHYASNPASGRVLAKAGMNPEGVARQNIIKSGIAHDCTLYAILREDWQTAQPR